MAHSMKVVDKSEWAARQRQLLELEKDAEKEEVVHALATLTAAECQEKGISLLALEVVDVRTALYGRVAITLRSRGGQGHLPAHQFGVGDEAFISSPKYRQARQAEGSKGEGDDGIAGVISKVTADTIELTADSAEDIDVMLPPVRLDLRYNEATHRKLINALDQLEQYTTGPALRLIDVLFFGVPPRAYETVRIQPFSSGLNESQIEAVSFALNTCDIALIHGPPGTGKTTAVVELILQAVAREMKLLVCAPSNTAVDNVLERVASFVPAPGSRVIRPTVVRLGHPTRLSAAVEPYSLEAQIMGHEGTDIVRDIRAEMNALQRQIARSKTAEARRENRRELRVLRKEARKREEAVVQQIIRSKHVVFCTNVGAASHLLNDVVFDMVIIDEAAQALEASCWIPMMRGRICVLAGDHKQLPPTIKSPTAADQGLSQTLFERVLMAFERPTEHAGTATSISRMLNVQYRMNKLICEWASAAMYHHQLQSDTSVAEHVLDDLPHVDTSRSANDMTNAIMLLIDTAGCGMEEAPSRGGSHKNEKEAAVVVAHIQQLLQTGLREEEIAVITPYNGQKELLQEYLQEQHPRLDIKSVDGFQGGEREAVVMSLVRSNERREVGFLADTRRINVAITRAKRHVAVIGDSDCVSADPFIRNLLDYISSHGEHRSALEYIPAHEAIPTSVPSVDAAESEAPAVTTARATTTAAAQAAAKKGGAAAGNDIGRDKPRPTKQPVRQQQQLQQQLVGQPQKPIEFSASPATTDAEIKDAMLAIRSCDVAFSSDVMVDDEPLVASVGDGWMAFTRHLKPGQRRLVHELATEYQLEHQSTGQGLARRILVRHAPQQPIAPPDGQGQAAPAAAESEAPVGTASRFDAMLDHSDAEEEEEEAQAEEAEEQKEEAKAAVGAETMQKAQDMAQSNATLRQLHEERMKRAAAKDVPPPQQVPAPSQEQKASGKKNKKKGKGAQQPEAPELDEDALLAAAILENQRAADKAKYRISSEALPNPDKVRTKSALSSKLAAQQNARLSKAAAETKASGGAKPRTTKLSKPPRKVSASGQLSR